MLCIQTEHKKILKVEYEPNSLKSKRKYPISLKGNLKHYSDIAFIIEDVPEDQILHIHQLAQSYPKLSSFYFYLNSSLISSEELCTHPEKEVILIEHCKSMIQVLDSYASKILISIDNEAEFDKRQLNLRETGIIDACMTLADAIQKRLPKDYSRSYKMAVDLSVVDNVDISRSVLETLRLEGFRYLYDVLESIYKLVYRAIKGNSANSLYLDKHEQHLDSYLPGHIQSLGKILKERFKFVAVGSKFDEKMFRKWFDHITTLSEIPEYNVREQALYMDIINSLCEFHGNGVLRYQSYALNSLLNSPQSFTILKFRMVNSQPAIAFEFDSRRNIKEFLEANPRLAEKRLAIDGHSLLPNEELQRACFYMNDIYTLEDYTDYLASAVNFLAGVCVDRYKKAMRTMIDEFNAKLEHIEAVLKNPEAPEKLRGAYFKLCRILYIDVDPLIPCSKYSSRCYLWAESGVYNPYEIEHPNPSSIMPIKRIVWKFWSFEGCMSSEQQNLGKKLNLLSEVMKLTTALVDLGLEDDYFINYMLQPICLLLGNHVNIEHWCSDLMQKIHETQMKDFIPSLESKLSKMLEEVLEFLKVAMKRRQNRHVKRILELYKSYKETGATEYLNNPELAFQLDGIMKELDFNVEMRSREAEEIVNYNKTGGEQETFLKDLNIEQLDYMNNEDRVYALDIYLLELLFSIRQSNNKNLSKMALKLIIQEINQRKALRKELKRTEIITSVVIQEVYEKMCNLKNQLNQSIKVLKQSQEESVESMDKVRYIEILKDVTDTTTEVYHMFKTQANNTYKLEKYQNLCKHSGLYEEFVSVLDLPFDNAIHFLMIKHSLKVLYYFTVSNRANQKLIFKHKDRLLDMIGYKIGATRLLSTIVSRSYDYELGRSIVAHLFELIDKDEFYHQLLELIRSFLIDDAKNLLPHMQIETLKLIFTSKSIKSLHHTANRVYDFLNPKLEHPKYPTIHILRFHIETIKTLTSCAIKNKFGVNQCRKLMKYTSIKRALQRPNTVINFMCKKYYLRFLYHVYIEPVPGVTAGLDIQDLEDLLQETIIPDLLYYKETLETIITLSYQGLYSNIQSETANKHKIDLSKRRILESSPDELLEVYKEDDDIELSDNDRKILEYWNYLSGSSNWHSHKDGLLYFIRDIFRHNSNEYSYEMMNIVQDMRDVLNEMSDILGDVEREHSELDFSEIIIDVNTCRESLPLARLDSEEQLEDEIELITNQLREFIIQQKLSLDEAFSIFDVNRNGELDYEEFRKSIKVMLGGKVRSSDIEKAFIQLDKDSDGIIQIHEFTKRLRKYFSKNPHPVRKRRPEAILDNKTSLQSRNTVSDDLSEDKSIHTDLEKFIEAFSIMCHDQDINNLVLKIRTKYVESNQLTQFLSQLNYAFKKQEHLVYLLQILKLLIPKLSFKPVQRVYDVKDPNTSFELEQIRNIQHILSESNVIELVLGIVSKEYDLKLIDSAVQVLLALLRYGNPDVQSKILNKLQETGGGYLMSYIRTAIRDSRDRIVERGKKVFMEKPNAVALTCFTLEDDERINPDDIVITFSKEDALNSRHTRRLLKLVKAFTENCYTEFQLFFVRQNSSNENVKSLSINLVNELASFLINIQEIGRHLKNDQEAQEVIPQCFIAMVELCRGPCVENQLIIGTRIKFYRFLNLILELERSNLTGSHIRGVVRILKELLEGEILKEIAQVMIEELDFSLLSSIAFEIYKNHIHPNKEYILQEWVQGQESSTITSPITENTHILNHKRFNGIPVDIWNLIDLGFDIVILIIRLRSLFPDADKLKDLTISEQLNEVNIHVNEILELGSRNERIRPSIMIFLRAKWAKIQNCLKPSLFEGITMEQAYIFYTSLISSVEIRRDDKLEVCVFRVPSMITYMSSKMRRKIVLEVNRSTYEEKIKSFFYNSEKYELQLSHLQRISRLHIISWWACKTQSLSNVTFLLVFILNILLLVSIQDKDNTHPDTELQALYYIISVTVTIQAIANYFLYIFENYPIIVYEQSKGSVNDHTEIRNEYKSLKGTFLMKTLIDECNNSEEIDKGYSYYDIMRAVMTNYDNIYLLIYVGISIGAWFYPLLYCILLLDVIRRYETLRDVLQSITINYKQLLLVSLLALFVLFLFSIVGFTSLGEYYATQSEGSYKNNYCHTLHDCTTSTLYNGIMSGYILLSSTIDQENYWNNQFFNIFFYWIMNVIFMNIVFGIIIDTFGELRDEKKAIKEDMNSACFICGKMKYEFEMRGLGWNHHTHIEHNLYAYLAYIIYIRRKPTAECNGIELSVKNRIMDNDVSFIPDTSKSLQQEE